MVHQFGPAAQNADERRLILRSNGPILDIIAHSSSHLAGMNCRGLIDTGASVSCIDNNTARKLGLNVIDTRPINSATEQILTPVYIGKIQIPTLDMSLPLKFYGAELLRVDKSYHYLLGRDLLSDFIFTYNGPEGTFQLAKSSNPLTPHIFDE